MKCKSVRIFDRLERNTIVISSVFRLKVVFFGSSLFQAYDMDTLRVSIANGTESDMNSTYIRAAQVLSNLWRSRFRTFMVHRFPI